MLYNHTFLPEAFCAGNLFLSKTSANFVILQKAAISAIVIRELIKGKGQNEFYVIIFLVDASNLECKNKL